MMHAVLNWPARRPWTALGIAAGVGILCALLAAHLRSDTSVESLFSPNDPAAVAMTRVLDQFPTAEELLILVTDTRGDIGKDTTGDPRPDRLLAFADRLERRIADDPQASRIVAGITYRADARSREFVSNVIAPNGLFYLSDAEFEAAKRRLTPPEMTDQFHRNEAMLAAPGPAAGALAKALLQDPLRLHEFLESRLAASEPFKTYRNSDAFISQDGRSLLIRVAGRRPPSDLAFCGQITSTVQTLAASVNTDRLALEFSGAYPIAAQSERSIRRDSMGSVIGSVACLALLFVLVFRRALPLFAVTFAPVAIGVLYGFGIYAVFRHSVTPLTAVIGAMLAGIGIDYSIFYLVHYLERRSAGVPPIEAASQTISTIGGALIAAWVTSVVGFIAVGFSSVRVLRDFSVAGSLGLSGALLGAIFVLPALLVLLDRIRKDAKAPAMRMSLRWLVDWIDRHAAGCVAVSSIVLLTTLGWLAVAGARLELESDPTVLHPRPNAPLDAEAHISRVMGGVTDSLIVDLRANSSDDLLRLAHRVNDRLSGSVAREAGVASTFGLASLLPDPEIANRRLRDAGPAMADRVIADFDTVVAASPFDPQAYAPYRKFLRTLLTPRAPPGVDDLLPYPQLAGALLPRQTRAGTAPTEAITLVFLRPAENQRAANEATVRSLRMLLGDLPGATLTGMAVLSLDSQATIHRDLPRLIAAAVVIIAVYLLLHFRSALYALLAVLPTLCSLACLLAIARIAGAKMNLANIVSVPLLIGIDVDYGIFLVSVARRCANRAELRQRVIASGQAVVLCATATTLGFGSLAFTSVPAVRSLGWAVGIGVATCAVSALFFLLPLLFWMRGRSEKSALAAAGKAAICAGVLIVMLGQTGCAPPSGRLSFPEHPLEKTANVEWYAVHHGARRDFGIAYDAAGRVDRLLYDDTGSGHADREYRLADYANQSVPHLILLLDSIPFETMAERYRDGDFRWFDPPTKMIAPFPSLTEICYSDVLHAPPLPGVTDQYFDPRDEQKKGILWDRVRGFEQPWERRLHYHANYMQQGLSFLHPDEWYAAELEQAHRALDRSPDRVTVVYIASAASMICKYGKPGAERVLDGARELCLQLLYERRGAIKISMMADHGHNYTPSTNVSLDDMLKAAGFHPADRIERDTDCVVEIDALVTCAGVHTRQPARVAAALCGHQPIELAIYMDGPRVMIQSARGKSAVECRDGKLRYVPLDADVLGYAPLIAQLKAERLMDADGFASDDVWFSRTLDHPWPNAPRRVWAALHGRFLNVPTVLLSLKDGYCAGYASYEKYIKMASTHGGLNQVNSATFVMTMTGRLTGERARAVRHEDVIGALEPGFEPRVQR